jgi:thiamine-phosphate pyrophosphorylase
MPKCEAIVRALEAPMSPGGLYPIVDLDTLERRGLDPVCFAERVLVARPPLIQLRAKSAGPRETLALLRALAPLARASGTLLFANDRADLALLGGADGVHVGQTDHQPDDVRRAAPGRRIGLSSHDPAELEAALAARPDYVAYGPVFDTTSKAAPDPTVGLEGLALAAERARRAAIPLVAIGGIDRRRARQVAEIADLVAVIGALIPESGSLEDVERTAVELGSAVRGR